MQQDVLRLLLTCLLVGTALGQIANSPRLEIPDGHLRGKYVLSREGRRIRAFLNIPYAKPPVGELRFKNPEPPSPWERERWAVDHPKPCVQPEKRHGEAKGQEDCLYLNVYTPKDVSMPKTHNSRTKMGNMKMDNSSSLHETMSNEIPGSTATVNGIAVNATVLNTTAAVNETKMNETSDESCPLLPVMVFFHGGGFEMGETEPFTHEYLMDSNIVLVTVQYRLGLLGFLSTGDEVLPGNLGLKDQRLALQWVQENIEHFGGCPEKVTIFGDGAGGASVHYHLLFSNPKTAMFRAGISMSGTALSPWAFRPPAEVSFMVDKLSNISGCPRNSQEFVDCLREKPAEDFVHILNKYKNETRGGCGEWATSVPVVGGVLENVTEDAIITANPWEKRAIMPWVVGVTSKEMLYEFTGPLVDRKNKMFKEINACFNETLPKVLGYDFSVADESALAADVRSFYLKRKPISRDSFADVVNAVSDASVVYPTFEAVKRGGRRSTWLYYYNYIGSNTYGASSLDGRIAPGRGDDLFLFFPRPLGKNIPRRNKEPDTVLSKKLVKLWTNFAINLDPSMTQEDGLNWPPVAPSTTFLNIKQDDLKVERPFQSPSMNFWSMEAFPNRDDNYKNTQAVGADLYPNVKKA